LGEENKNNGKTLIKFLSEFGEFFGKNFKNEMGVSKLLKIQDTTESI